MAKPERERIGTFVITTRENVDASGIVCAMCDKQLATFDPANDTHNPDPDQLQQSGAVAVPNFGWFCSQHCGDQYSKKYGTRFQRNEHGEIQYYP